METIIAPSVLAVFPIVIPKWINGGKIHYSDWASSTTIVRGHALIILDLLEIGQDISVAPPFISQCLPPIIVSRVSAKIKHEVDRTGTTKHFAKRQGNPPVVEMGFFLSRVSPIDTRLWQL